MACCGKTKDYTLTSPKGSGLVIAPAEKWLPFARNKKPPAGWGVMGFSAKSPEQAADLVAGKQLELGTFTHMQNVYAIVVAEYCSRPGLKCP